MPRYLVPGLLVGGSLVCGSEDPDVDGHFSGTAEGSNNCDGYSPMFDEESVHYCGWEDVSAGEDVAEDPAFLAKYLGEVALYRCVEPRRLLIQQSS